MAGDIEIYEDAVSACKYLEVYDLSDTAAYDARGYPLEILSEGYEVTGMKIASQEAKPDHLIRKLQEFIRRVGPDRVGVGEPRGASLEQLLVALIRFRRGGAS